MPGRVDRASSWLSKLVLPANHLTGLDELCIAARKAIRREGEENFNHGPWHIQSISAPNYAAGWQGKVSLGTTEVNVKFESSQSGFEVASAAVQQASCASLAVTCQKGQREAQIQSYARPGTKLEEPRTNKLGPRVHRGGRLRRAWTVCYRARNSPKTQGNLHARGASAVDDGWRQRPWQRILHWRPLKIGIHPS